MNPRFFFLAALTFATLASIVPGVGVAQNLPNLGDTERQELAPSMERKLGEQIMRDIRRDRDYLEDAPLLEYLNNFGNALVAARPEARGEAGFDFFFFAVRDPMMNAFALPGGFIGVHSALIWAAQNESELASVLAHEIGHVAQRHIARMLGQQHQDALIPLATVLLAALASRSGADASSALLMGGQGMVAQRQLNFSRDAEREADRVGLQIMREAGFDTSGMISFFARLQSANRSYTDAAPAFLRSHPLTTERIADIQARTREQRYRQHADSLDFYLIRSRVRVLQDPSAQGLHEAGLLFNEQLLQNNRLQTAAGKYGLAYIAFKRDDYAQAQKLLHEARSALQGHVASGAGRSAVLANLAIDIQLGANHPEAALKEIEAARAQFPLARGFVHQHAQALMLMKRYEPAVAYLRDQAQLYRQEPQLQQLLAQAYAGQGKQALQHLALAESYGLSGNVASALEQLAIARRAPDASFYDQAVIDAREREFRTRWKDALKDTQKTH